MSWRRRGCCLQWPAMVVLVHGLAAVVTTAQPTVSWALVGPRRAASGWVKAQSGGLAGRWSPGGLHLDGRERLDILENTGRVLAWAMPQVRLASLDVMHLQQAVKLGIHERMEPSSITPARALITVPR